MLYVFNQIKIFEMPTFIKNSKIPDLNIVEEFLNTFEKNLMPIFNDWVIWGLNIEITLNRTDPIICYFEWKHLNNIIKQFVGENLSPNYLYNNIHSEIFSVF